MIPISHILIVAQDDFLHRQVDAMLNEPHGPAVPRWLGKLLDFRKPAAYLI
jgi:hypothetical protein